MPAVIAAFLLFIAAALAVLAGIVLSELLYQLFFAITTGLGASA